MKTTNINTISTIAKGLYDEKVQLTVYALPQSYKTDHCLAAVLCTLFRTFWLTPNEIANKNWEGLRKNATKVLFGCNEKLGFG